MQTFNELTEPLVDQSALDETLYISFHPWEAFKTHLYTTKGDIKANNCLELDLIIKGKGKSTDSKYRTDAEAKFNKFNCRDKIEALRTKSLIDLQTKGSIKAEESILGKGFTEQKTYIILGALVLLTGFYIVVKK
jgi:hypothetical protein